MKRFTLFIGLFIPFCLAVAAAAQSLQPVDLRCEYRRDPLGIDTVQPQLFWRLQAIDDSQRGLRQQAYRILVASSSERLAQDQGDLWDSHRVASDQTTQVVYRGQPLVSGQACFWKVRIWDQDGQASDWSPTGSWSMGLLKPDDWQADWIGLDAPVTSGDVLAGSKWIWYPETASGANAPVGSRYFRRSLELAGSEPIANAVLYLAADNRFTVSVNGNELKSGGGFNAASPLDLTQHLKPGRNVLAVAVVNEGDAPNPAGLLASLVVRTTQSEAVRVVSDAGWRSSNAEAPGWTAVDFDDSEWKPAQVLGPVGCAPWGKVTAAAKIYRPSPLLRRDFAIGKTVQRATVYATALGVYQIRLNGQRVGRDYLTPGWTDYRKRLYYNAYDVTSMLRSGDNTLGAVLADGWYAGNLSILGQFRYGKDLRLRTQLAIEYTDGSREVIGTGPEWRASLEGPIRRSDMQDGETFDATQDPAGWDSPGFDAASWQPVQVGSDYNAPLQAYPGETIQTFEEITPVSLTEPRPGVFVYDLGQNFAGWARLKIQAAAATTIILRFAEMLNADGTIYTENLRSARCTDEYIAKGDGVEIWEPQFTFHGFRYVELTGTPTRPGLDAITGVAAYSANRPAASFECSNPMLNKLYNNIVWGQRSNYFEVPTDCPQRDERLGWTGDTQVFIRTGCYNQDVAAFFTKWLVDLEDSQRADGVYGNQAPELHGHGSPGWADAGIICPWTIWQVYGDTRVIEKHYDAMARWIAHLQQKSNDLLRPATGYGDWLSIGEDTPKDLIATAYFAYVTRLMAEMAQAVDRPQDAAEYSDLFQAIRAAFMRAYVAEDGRVQGDSQTGYLLALRFDLLPEDLRSAAADHLVRRIEAQDWHLSTGFLGVNLLLPTLEASGRTDVAYRLLQNTTYPSWGYSVVNGATTSWERWNSYTIEHGFGDAGMNSFNHYAYGSAGQWMFSAVAGIDTDAPGFQRILIRPRIGGGLDFVHAHYDSIHGRIQSHWQRTDAGFRLNVTIPPNTIATVYVPTTVADVVTEGGKPAIDSPHVQYHCTEQGCAVFVIASGTYEFTTIE